MQSMNASLNDSINARLPNLLRWLRSAWGYWLAELKRLLESGAA